MIFSRSVPEEVISLNNKKKKGVMLIWFYADWCTHCRNMEEEWEKLSKTHPMGLKLAKVESSNMNDYEKSPGEKELVGYPTLRLYNNNKVIKEYDGDRSYASIYKFANEYLKKMNRSDKNKLSIVRAKKKNNINGKLIQSIVKHKKKTKKSKKLVTVKNNKNNNNKKSGKKTKKPANKSKKGKSKK